MSDADLEKAAGYLDKAADSIDALDIGDLPDYELNSITDLRDSLRSRAYDLRDRTEGDGE